VSRFITFYLADEAVGDPVAVDPDQVIALRGISTRLTEVCLASGRAFGVRGSCAEVVKQLECSSDRAFDRIRLLEDRVEALERGIFDPPPPDRMRRVVR
jgi:hypothetical protein